MKSTAVIALAIEKYQKYVGDDKQRSNAEINKVIARFTFITISALPCIFTSGFFGMNVKVPFSSQETTESSLAPFFGIIACCIVTTIAMALFARYFNYI